MIREREILLIDFPMTGLPRERCVYTCGKRGKREYHLNTQLSFQAWLSVGLFWIENLMGEKVPLGINSCTVLFIFHILDFGEIFPPISDGSFITRWGTGYIFM